MYTRREAGLRKAMCLVIGILMITIIVLNEVPQGAEAQVNVEWTVESSGIAIEVDSLGNIYVVDVRATVSTHCDYVTMKYDPYGNELWKKIYDATGYDDEPRAMTIDSSGNVYVTGNSWGGFPDEGGTSQDYLTIKYDTDGNVLWTARYNGGLNGEDMARDIVVDEFSGNVYVTGITDFNHGGTWRCKFTTVAYDSDGNLLWDAINTRLGNIHAHGNAIALDSKGNIYVTGHSLMSYPSINTIKYDPFGNDHWIASYDHPRGGMALDIAVGPTDDIYVTGTCNGDIVTIAYNTIGSELWAQMYNGPRNGEDCGREITTDSAGNIYVTGWIDDVGMGRDFATIKYDSFGNEQWVRRHSGALDRFHFHHSAITTDPFGNIYTTGLTEPNATTQEYLTIAFDTLGNELWTAKYGGGSSKDITADVNGFVYVTGGIVTIKYAPGPPNEPPVADALGPYIYEEGAYAPYISGSHDPEGMPLEYRWDLDNDGIWDTDWGNNPFVIHRMGDDFEGEIGLQVGDGRALGIDTASVTIINVAPSLGIATSSISDIELGLRVAGRKHNDVGMTICEDGIPAGFISVERTPGSPDDQMAWMPMSLDSSKTYTANVTFTPEEPPNVGANPVWIYIKHANGTIDKIHHTFNIQQSKKRNSQHWNHIEPWEVDLDDYLKGGQIGVTSHITDPGSDDIFITYSYGSQTINATYLNNPPDPDPYPSPEVNPVDIVDIQNLDYEGSGLLTVTAWDDDGGTTIQTLHIP